MTIELLIKNRVNKLNKYMESIGAEPHVVDEVKFLMKLKKILGKIQLNDH